MEIANRAAIITGGASGMGAAAAKLLSQQGAKVALLDLNLASATQLANEINGLAIECDVTQSDSVEQALQIATKKHGAATICINCAGIVHSRRAVNQQGPMPLDEFQRVLNINVTGTFNVMRLTAAQMMSIKKPAEQEEGGIIINTASVAAYEGQIGQTAYSASKGAIVAMTLPAAREFAQFGIRVMCIAPGLVDTPMFAKIPPDARSALAAAVPFPKRLAHPEEYAQLALSIINNPMLNGSVIRLDGALRMQAK
jgi:NAD(P)-dependent dehydrogenase (short-subunit alcohol dehydrogenase family)